MSMSSWAPDPLKKLCSCFLCYRFFCGHVGGGRDLLVYGKWPRSSPRLRKVYHTWKWRIQEIHGARRRERAAVLRYLCPRGRGGERNVYARQEYYLAVAAIILNRAHQYLAIVWISHMHVLPLLNEIPPPSKSLYRSSCTWIWFVSHHLWSSMRYASYHRRRWSIMSWKL